MTKKINISKIEELLQKAGLENGELDELMQPVKDLNNQRRYGLVWEEPDNGTFERDFAEEDLLLNFPFISELKDKEIYHGEDNPDHLLIEGDNLHALQMMQYTHKDKVDVIYIDPPYNTGNTDFVYNDKIVDSEDSWRHSKWLSFMNKRLRLARELMTDDGVIFISIDDNEQAQLKLLMDQVFGEENFITNLVWEKTQHTGRQSLNTYSNVEYILVYGKRIHDDGKLKNLLIEREQIVFEDAPLYNGGNPKRVLEFEEGTVFFRKKGVHTETTNDTYKLKDKVELVKSERIIGDGGYPYTNKNKFRLEFSSRWSQEEINRQVHEKGTVFLVKTDSFAIRALYDEGLKDSLNIAPWQLINTSGGKVTKSRFGESVSTTSSGTRDVSEILGDGVFSYPKPKSLVKYLISLTKADSIVLDFFAGSGTTAHAVMELNEEDGGNRQAILVTNNEVTDKEERDKMVELGLIQPFTGSRRGTIKHREWLADIEEFKTTDAYQDFINSDDYKDLGIARAVTYPRNQKVIDGYTTPKGKDIDGLYRNNFRHFVIELVEDLQDDNLNAYHLIEQTTDIIRLKESVYSNVEFVDVDGIPFAILSNKYTEIFVILDSMVFDEDIEKIIATYSTEGQEKVLYSNYDKFNYSDHDIRFEELPKELLQAIKQKEVE